MTTPTASTSGRFDLGTVSGAITLNANGAFSTIQQFKSQVAGLINNTSAMFRSVGSQISDFGASFTQMMTPFALGMGAGIKAAGNFQSTLAEIQARTGLAEDAMESIRQKALQLGADTSFSAQQAGDAFLQLLTSGSSELQAMQQIDAVLRGAEASGADLAFTADFLTNVLSQFNLEAEQSEVVMQSLVSATGSSSATLDSLSQGFSNVGAVAASFGLTVDETAASLAVLHEKGIQGAEGGTQLKTILTELGKPGARKELERLGVAFTDSEGNIRNFDDIIKDLNVSMADMTQAERRESILELAGSYGQAGLSALLMEDGISTMLDTMEDQESFIDIAKKKMEGFIGQVTSLQGSIETLLIEAFTPFIESLTPYVTKMVEIVNAIREWVVANQDIVQPMLRMVGVLITLGPVLFGVGKAISFVGFLIGALTSPINLVLIAITALVAAWTTNFLGFRDVTMQVIDTVIETLQGLWSAFQAGGLSGAGMFIWDTIIVPMLVGLHDGAIRLWQHARTLAAGIFDALKTGLPVVGQWVNDNIITPMQDGFNNLQNVDWSAVGTGILNAIGAFLRFNFNFWSWVFENVHVPLFNAAKDAISNISWGEVGTNILSAIGTGLSTLMSWATWAYENILVPLFENAKTAIESIDWFAVGAGIVNAIGAAIKATFDFVAWIVDSLFGPVTENAEGASDGVDWGQVGNAIMNAIGAFFRGVFNFVTWIFETIISPLILGAADAIANANWSEVGQNLMNALADALPNIQNWVRNNIINPIQNALAGGFDPLRSIELGLTGGTSGIAGGNMNAFHRPQSQDSGGFGRAGVPYLIGKRAQPEIFVPQTNGTFIPNFDQMMQGGDNYNFAAGAFVIQANSEAEGRAAARGFGDELQRIIDTTG